MNEQPTRDEVIFHAALELQGEPRAKYLALACQGDPPLGQRIERLLEARAEAEAFFAQEPLQAVLGGPPGAVPARLPAAEKPGDRIGRYQLLAQIGEGGMGVVYLAEQEEPVRRRVALKVIKLGMDTQNVIARFEAERQALAVMDHPNIAKVFDAGATAAGRPYFVMELVRGIRITDYCDRRQLPTPERLGLFIQVCRAIQHAHQKGIIHRDIKPSNILVAQPDQDSPGVPKVIDFGVAKATEQKLTDQPLFTAVEQFLGTPAYMSPEQAQKTSLDIDTRSDIYALGVLLYELLTGQTPFDARQLLAAGLDELRRTIREQEPVRPSTRLSTMQAGELTTTAQHRQADPPKLIHAVRGDLDWIVMKCLEKDRTRRYETANGVVTDLQRHLNHEPVMARPPGNLYRFQKLLRRHQGTVTAVAAVAVALVLGTVVSTWQALRANRLRAHAQTEADHARRNAYASDMLLAQQTLALGNLGLALDLLNRQRPPPGQRELRGWEWRYLWKSCQSQALTKLCQETNWIFSLSVSADGKWLAIGQQEGGTVSIWDLPARREIARLPAGGNEVRTAFSPRESLLAFSAARGTPSAWDGSTSRNQSSIYLWNVERQQFGPELQFTGRCTGLKFSADGQTLLTSTLDLGDEPGKLTFWRLPEGKKLKSYPAPQTSSVGATHVTAFAVARDFSLAAIGGSSTFRLIDLATGQERWNTTTDNDFFTNLAISPDGKILASAEGITASAIRFWDTATGRELAPPLRDHRVWISEMLFWPDGKTLATAGSDQTIRLWDVSGLTHVRPLGPPFRGEQFFTCIALQPDNQTLVSGGKDGSVWVWDTANLRDTRAPVTLPGKIYDWCFTPDSQSIVTADWQGRIARWGGKDFQEMTPLFAVDANAASCFSQDARLLAVGSANGLVQIWNVQRRAVDQEFRAGAGQVWPWRFLPHGDKLMGGKSMPGLDSPDHSCLWGLTPARELLSWPCGHNSTAGAFTPDERWFVQLFTGASSLRDLASGRGADLKLDLRWAYGAAISPDGKTFAAASWLGYTRLWETATWQQITNLRSFQLAFHSVAFSSDGTRLMTGSNGQLAVQLWETESYQQLLALEGQGSLFSTPTFSPDGSSLGSMSQGGLLHLWRAPSMAEIQAAEAAKAP